MSSESLLTRFSPPSHDARWMPTSPIIPFCSIETQKYWEDFIFYEIMDFIFVQIMFFFTGWNGRIIFWDVFIFDKNSGRNLFWEDLVLKIFGGFCWKKQGPFLINYGTLISLNNTHIWFILNCICAQANAMWHQILIGLYSIKTKTK